MSEHHKELDKIRARVESASAGPWDNFPSDSYPLYIVGVPPEDEAYADVIVMVDEDSKIISDFTEADVDFICAARTDIPKLLKAIDAYAARLNEYGRNSFYAEIEKVLA